MTAVFVAAFAGTASSWSSAQTPLARYPEKPVRILVPYAAGGGVDIVGRILAARLSEEFGHQFIVDNRVGAGGTVGADIVAKAPADGYTALITNSGFAYSAWLYSKLPYDTLRDLAAANQIGTTPSLLVVHPSVAARNVKELIDLIKSRRVVLNYASGGVGGAVHLAFELFQSMAGVRVTHIPYKGVGPALVDTAGGQVQMAIAGMPAVIGYIKGNRLRALGVSSARRSYLLPELPTIAEAGVPGYEYTTWYGLFLPAAVPKAVVSKLNQGVIKALSHAEVRDKFVQQGVEVESGTPEQFALMVKHEVTRWGAIIKAAGIRAE